MITSQQSAAEYRLELVGKLTQVERMLQFKPVTCADCADKTERLHAHVQTVRQWLGTVPHLCTAVELQGNPTLMLRIATMQMQYAEQIRAWEQECKLHATHCLTNAPISLVHYAHIHTIKLLNTPLVAYTAEEQITEACALLSAMQQEYRGYFSRFMLAPVNSMQQIIGTMVTGLIGAGLQAGMAVGIASTLGSYVWEWQKSNRSTKDYAALEKKICNCLRTHWPQHNLIIQAAFVQAGLSLRPEELLEV